MWEQVIPIVQLSGTLWHSLWWLLTELARDPMAALKLGIATVCGD